MYFDSNKLYNDNIKFFGVGGNLMENEGLVSLYNIQEFNVIGFLNTLINLKKLRNYVNEIVKFIIKEKPQIVITIDIINNIVISIIFV